MLKIKTGKVPNLPLWRLQKMSDEEIEKFNNGFMMIERLEESSVGISGVGINAKFQNAQAIEKIKSMLELKEMTYKEQAFKNIEGRIDSIQKLSIECVEYIYLAAYNEAIEAAIKVCDINSAENVRKLKKMKNKTLCLYWPQYDKVLNVRLLENGLIISRYEEIEKFNNGFMMIEHIEINAAQMRSFRAWLEDNNI